MTKLLHLLIIFILISGCSFNKNSKFWTSKTELEIEKDEKFKEIFIKDKVNKKELNPNLKFNLDLTQKKYINELTNVEKYNFNIKLEKSSKFRFSKIKNFHKYDPGLSFYDNNLVFFDNKGTVLQFDNQSKLIWKKNYYSKNEKKLNPILQFANNKEFLIVADNIAKFYLLDLKTGNLI